ncbi:zinc-finger domain-containing protein [Rhabdochromatium marinum]|uniref:zinc-finger domain-containing protein n=1 Tax=Rhabdochromatium marinum TaxID=48729 RepID=UPI001905B52F|nr:zinc-finger domain-containing protein [Rhabdochromatium marinum]MBK1648980.1 hypothetical protein [Rhabdochromatium marinum]
METIELPFASNPPDNLAGAQPSQPTPIKVQAGDLPLSCPRPEDQLWNLHPRVYLPIEQAPDRRVVCPYCGAVYELEGEVESAH